MTDTSPIPDPNNPTSFTLSVPEAVTLLRKGQMEVLDLLPWSSNYTFLARVTQGDRVVLAVYKPRRGERPLWDFPTGTLYRREVAAFLVSDALGWHLVPPTVARSGEHGIGMVQLYIDHEPEEHFFTFRDPWPEALTQVALFDHLINNADRKGGHCLRDAAGRIWAIDHGVCFHAEPKLRTVIWETAGEPIPDELLEDLRALQATLQQGGTPLVTALADLLSPDEQRALRQRLAALIRSGRFPAAPAHRRAIPWPMV